MRKAADVFADIGDDMDMDLDDGDIVTDVFIISRVQRLDSAAGDSAVILTTTDNTDPVVQLGLLAAAQRITDTGWQQRDEEAP